MKVVYGRGMNKYLGVFEYSSGGRERDKLGVQLVKNLGRCELEV